MDLCICEEVAKTETRLKVELQRRKFGKPYTVIRGLDPKEFNLKEMAVILKTKLACGGTVKGDTIELQGNHEYRIIPLLEKMGFESDSIDVLKR
ncbi:MAG: stress response translation initiation inhibitor YciH [Candidatus Heimdallarchaeota archaeon]|nr:stress response translation initiation inhibitor YciH [Candidatus Heimdallarchaeota archaeon]